VVHFDAIPLKRAGRLLLIEAVIDGIEGNLIFDTGATGLVLNRTYFRNRVLMEGEHSMGITGSAGNLGCVIAEKLQIGDLYYENVKADVSELGHIENRRGIKVIGLLGFGMIRELETVIDVAHNELYLYRIDRRGERVAEQNHPLSLTAYRRLIPGTRYWC
jgi:predicted aspartyl protease